MDGMELLASSDMGIHAVPYVAGRPQPRRPLAHGVRVEDFADLDDRRLPMDWPQRIEVEGFPLYLCDAFLLASPPGAETVALVYGCRVRDDSPDD